MFIVDAIVNLFSKLVAKKTEDKRALVEDHKADDDMFAAKTVEDDKVREDQAQSNYGQTLIKNDSFILMTAIIIVAGVCPEPIKLFFTNVFYAVPQPMLWLWGAEVCASFGIRIKGTW